MTKVMGQVQSKQAWIRLPEFVGESWKPMTLLAAICLACYGNTFFNEYSFDDDFITGNVFIQKGVSGIPEILTSPYLSKEGKNVDYRPIPAILFALEVQLFGFNPFVSHLINVLAYVVLVVIIFYLFKYSLKLDNIHPYLPFIVSAFYAVHPSHTEVVASVKNRDEIISLIFALVALVSAHRYFIYRSARFFRLTFIFLLCSFLSKVTSLPVVPIIILMGYFFGIQKSGRDFLYFSSLLFFFAAIYFSAIALTTDREMFDLENPLVKNKSVSIAFGTAFETLLFYLKFMLYPWPHRFYYGYDMIPMIPLSNPMALFSLGVNSVILFAGILLFRRRQLIGFFILSYYISIILYSNFAPYPGIISERVLLIPSLWFIAALVAAAFESGKFFSRKKILRYFRKMAVGVAVLIFLSYCVLTVRRNFQWKDLLTLMSSDIGYLNNSALANYFYAMALKKQGEVSPEGGGPSAQYFDLSKKHLKRTLELAPHYRSAYYHLGMIYEYRDAKRDSAFHYFHEGYHIDPDFNPLKFQFARQLYLRHEYADSEVLFGELFNEIPDDTFTLYFYARVLFELGKHDQAFEVNHQLWQMAPREFYAYLNAGIFFNELGNTQQAAENYEKALLFGFKDEDIYRFLIQYYSSAGNTQKLAQIRRLFN